MNSVSKNLEFTSSKILPATTLYSLGNTIDLGKTGLDIGNGADLTFVVDVSVVCVVGTNAGFTFELVSSDTDPVPTVGGAAAAWTSPTVHYSSGLIAAAAYAVGTRLVAVHVPRGTYKRYLGIRASWVTASLTSGQFAAYLAQEVNGFKATPQGVIGV